MRCCWGRDSFTMQPKAFGEKLKYYRRQTQDKERGAYLTQGRLADLINDHFGLITFAPQQISYWEQGKYLPKDREMLQALVKILMTYQGISSLAEANQWLNLGGYASLSEAELQAIGAEWSQGDAVEPPLPTELPTLTPDPHIEVLPSHDLLEPLKEPMTQSIFSLTHRLINNEGYILLVGLGGGITTWLLLNGFFEWPFANQDIAISAHIKLGLANFFIPLGIHLFLKTDEPTLTSWSDWLSHKLFTNAAARVMYYVTLMVYLVVTSLAYWGGLWPWPVAIHVICWVSFWLVTYSFIKEVKYWSQPIMTTLYLELVMITTGQIITLLAWFTYTAHLPIYLVMALFLPLGLLLAKFNPSPRAFLMIILGIVAFACSLMGLQVLLVLMGG